MTLPIRARLTLWYVAVLALIIVALGMFLGYRLRADLVDGLDQTLVTRAQQISLALGSGDFEDIGDVKLSGLPSGNAIAQILDADGRVVQTAGDPDPGKPLVSGAVIRAAGRGSVRGQVQIHHGEDSEPYRYLAVRLSGDRILVLGTPMETIEAAVRRLVILLAVGVPGALALAGAGGFLLASRALRPIDRMTRTAASIGSDDLSARLHAPAIHDEVGRLATTLNQMLARLQAAIEEQRRFTADASHELRTPLSIMQAEIDVALRSPDVSAEGQAALQSTGEEVQRMTRVVEDLLLLARADEGVLELSLAPVDLAEVAAEVAERFRPQAQDKGVTIVADTPLSAMVWGDQERLRRLISNLVGNAVKYTPAGGRIDVVAVADTHWVRLEVADTGVGIAPEALPHVFDRFFRADTARSRADGGAGLGLAISLWIAKAHGGSIDVQSQISRGSRFIVRLPKS